MCAKGNYTPDGGKKNQYEKSNVKYVINNFKIYYVEITVGYNGLQYIFRTNFTKLIPLYTFKCGYWKNFNFTSNSHYFSTGQCCCTKLG